MSATLAKTKPFAQLVDECANVVAEELLHYDVYDQLVSASGQFKIRMKPIEGHEESVFTKQLFDKTLSYYE